MVTMRYVTAVQFLISSLFVLFANAANDTNNGTDKFIVFYGETQTGKSSMINAIYNESIAETGYGVGVSTTALPKVYSKSFTHHFDFQNESKSSNFTLHMMDTPGFLDTRGLYTDEEILDQNILTLLQIDNVTQVDVIFITESLAGDSVQLTRNVNKLRQIFGPSVMSTIVILGTKETLANVVNGGEKQALIKELCKKLGLKYMSYDSTKAYDYNDQFQVLIDMIFNSGIEPYRNNRIIELEGNRY